MVDYAKGNALALKVLGSHFHRKSKIDWEKGLCNLSQISSSKVHDVLKISYNDLQLDERSIFLDIACFFNGNNKDWVMDILDDNRVNIDYRLNVLVEKSLVSRSDGNMLQMHDLLQEMGRELVRQESIKNPGKRSRLWHHEDIYDVLKRNKGTDSIEGIFLDMSNIRDLDLTPGAFAKMSNLRLLKLYVPHHFDISNMSSKVHLSEALACLPDELRYLHWHGYPWRTLPINFNPGNLIELSLPYSKVEQLWEGKKEASKLKIIDLEHSDYLSRIPDAAETPNVERISVPYCNKLSCLPSSIQNFNYIRLLSFRGLTGLSFFPDNIHFRSPIDIDLSDCINLRKFPSISGNVIKLRLGSTAIKEVPSSIERLTSLECLDLRKCYALTSLPTSICKLKSLRKLELRYCLNFGRFPEILEEMKSLEYIRLEGTLIKELPSSVELLTGLVNLALVNCRELGSFASNLAELKSLGFVYDIQYSGSDEFRPSSINRVDTASIITRHQRFGRGFVFPPLSGLSGLSKLTMLLLNDCDIREIPQDIGSLSSLEMLDLGKNDFESLPTSIKQLSRLITLLLCDCNMLDSLPELPRSLRFLNANDCKRLGSLPELPECLENLDASLLERQYRTSDSFSSRSIEYRFNFCPKLKEKANDILAAESQLRIQQMAITTLNEKMPHQFGISLSGSEVKIPEWFSNRCSGSSITIQLPPSCGNTNLIGLGFCAVIGVEKHSDVRRGMVTVRCSFKIENDVISTSDYFIFFGSDAVLLGFGACSNVRLPEVDHHTTVSFDFSLYYDERKFPSLKVKCCGVSPVYAHPNEFPPNTFTVNMVPPTEEECRKWHNEFHDEAGTSGTTTGSGSVGRTDEEEIKAPQQESSFLSQIFRCLGLDCACLRGVF
ncbi:Disease resistance protein (TIR-NBS-LRR class) family [Melia azedarach]|uniref:Disease resistance protein (TIR-NBS-LRR class) family n=1 Tax=Melia azedarach TaxID=155640 RepID=A0ACC1YJ05_MELAZ|nr:Disease resistance protein (TIR-NBS-LRR class) family [Melia azedarach]